MIKSYYKLLSICFIYLYCGCVYGDQPVPMQPPGTPSSVKFWDIPNEKELEEIKKIFSNNMDKYRYFAQVVTNIEDSDSHASSNYLISNDRDIEVEDLDLFGKIIALENLDKSPREREEIYKMKTFLDTNYKTQILPYEVYDNKHLPRPFYLYELKSWSFSAVDRNDINFLRSLLDNYNLLNIKNNYGYGLLSYAVLKNRPDVVMFMIRRGANLNETNFHKETPLIIAAKHNNLKIVEMLAESGCNINHKDKSGHSSLDKAKINGNDKMHRYLQSVVSK